MSNCFYKANQKGCEDYRLTIRQKTRESTFENSDSFMSIDLLSRQYSDFLSV